MNIKNSNRIFFGIFFVLLLLSLSIGSVSALEINPFADKKFYEKEITPDMSDFIKSDFNSKYGVIRISETFFWFESDKIAEYSLIENTEQCLIDCSAKGKTTLYQEGQLFEDTKFRDRLENNININAQYFIKKAEEYIVETPIYEEICEDVYNSQNDTTYETCSNNLVGTLNETKTREIWNAYNKEILNAGDYEWKLEGKKEATQSIDFIPITLGQ